MARLALAVGYTSRGNSRAEEPVLLYLGTSFQAAKAALASLPENIGYGEAYRLDGGPNKRFHADPASPADPSAADSTDSTETPAADSTETPAEEPEGLAKVIGKKK